MATIADVAARAGVGIGTVSRVLNDSHQVRPETRTKVLAAIDELDYRPSRAKRSVARTDGGLIGIVVPYFDEPSVVMRLRGIVDRLQPHGFQVVLYNVDTPAQARRLLGNFPWGEELDGLIVMTLPLLAEEGDALAEAPFPVVLIDTVHPKLPSVGIDDVAGGRMATQHLLALGHRRVAFIGEPPRNQWNFVASQRREVGYRDAMRAAGLDIAEEYVKHGWHLHAAGRQMAEELLRHPQPPTAVFAASDVQAAGVMEVARSAGWKIPANLSVVGYDDIDLATYFGLTTVRQPLEFSGQWAADFLLGSLSGGAAPESFSEELRLELVVRETTDAVGPKRPALHRIG